MKITRRTIGLVVADLAVVVIALLIAYTVRFDGDISQISNGQRALVFTPIAYFLSFLLFRIYRIQWRYSGLRDAFYLGMACLTALMLTGFFRMTGLCNGYPYSVAVIQSLITLLGVYGVRAALRVWDFNLHPTSYRLNDPEKEPDKRRILIVGAGDAGEMMGRDFRRVPGYDVVGYVDDDPEKHGTNIHGAPVIGDCHAIPSIVADKKVDDVLLAIPSASGDDIRRILNICNQTKAAIRILPGLPQMLQQMGIRPFLREVQIEDLLRRAPVQIDQASINAYVKGQRVLITGGGGSIGGELCRQIAAMGPAELILLGHGENSIFEMQQELRNNFRDLNTTCYIASIKQLDRLEFVFEQCHPTVVFHAAAHKHVPLMENNSMEAILNNVMGTRNVINMCMKYDVRRCVCISTDKAVNPSSVMGATKRVSELLIQCAAHRSKNTRFAIVRFGNVLGSRGSVVPMMKRQIAAGGPVTVTHPDMTRYFMTIPEACRLVLQAGVFGSNGEIYVLDMGEPVKISFLAEELIRLSGFVPGQDIQITYVGIREGEKLHEELWYDAETMCGTEHPSIRMVVGNGLDVELTSAKIDELLHLAMGHNVHEARALLADLASAPAVEFSSVPSRSEKQLKR